MKKALLIALIIIEIVAIFAIWNRVQAQTDFECSEQSLEQLQSWQETVEDVQSEAIDPASNLWAWAVVTSFKHQIEAMPTPDQCHIAYYGYLSYLAESHAVLAAMKLETNPGKVAAYELALPQIQEAIDLGSITLEEIGIEITEEN